MWEKIAEKIALNLVDVFSNLLFWVGIIFFVWVIVPKKLLYSLIFRLRKAGPFEWDPYVKAVEVAEKTEDKIKSDRDILEKVEKLGPQEERNFLDFAKAKALQGTQGYLFGISNEPIIPEPKYLWGEFEKMKESGHGNCPVCGTPLELTGTVLSCLNPNCSWGKYS
jgi:hypothetical protein